MNRILQNRDQQILFRLFKITAFPLYGDVSNSNMYLAQPVRFRDMKIRQRAARLNEEGYGEGR